MRGSWRYQLQLPAAAFVTAILAPENAWDFSENRLRGFPLAGRDTPAYIRIIMRLLVIGNRVSFILLSIICAKHFAWKDETSH